MRKLFLVVALLFVCSIPSFALDNENPETLSRTLSGDNKGDAANNAQCQLFSKAEVSEYMGTTVSEMNNAAMGTGCQWVDKDADNSMMVQILPADYYSAASGVESYKKLPDVGVRGFVVLDMGWTAGAILGEEFVVVALDGTGASEAKAITLLKETLKRRQAQAGEK